MMVPHIPRKVAGKKILISEATFEAGLLFDDEMDVDCLSKQVIWEHCSEISVTEAEEGTGRTSPHSRAYRFCMGCSRHSNSSAAHFKGDCSSVQGAASFQDASQTSGGDEGLLDIYALNREVRRLKKQTLSQAKQILKLKAKLKKLSKFVAPVVKHHALWVENQNLKKQKRRRRE
ncbi:hypothetical protein Tco_0557014 [Tanacetum coccineum]